MQSLIASIKYNLLLLLKPVQKFMQRLGRHETVIDRKTVDYLLSVIKEGDILLSHENQRLTNLFIKGFYDHAAIVSSKMTVVEAVGDIWTMKNGRLENIGGVREIDLEEWLFKKDFVCVIRVLSLDENKIKYAAANSLSHIGKSYDYTFSSKGENLYCSELVYVCYKPEIPYFLNELDAFKEILPIEYLNLSKEVSYLQVIADTKADIVK